MLLLHRKKNFFSEKHLQKFEIPTEDELQGKAMFSRERSKEVKTSVQGGIKQTET